MLLVLLATDDRWELAFERRRGDRRAELRRRPSPDRHGDGALVDPLSLGVEATAEQHRRALVEDGFTVHVRHHSDRSTAAYGRQPRQTFWPREKRTFADIAGLPSCDDRQLGVDVGSDRVEVDARVPMLRRPHGKGDGEQDVGGRRLRRHQLGDHCRRVHLGSAEHTGVDPWLEAGDVRRSETLIAFPGHAGPG